MDNYSPMTSTADLAAGRIMRTGDTSTKLHINNPEQVHRGQTNQDSCVATTEPGFSEQLISDPDKENEILETGDDISSGVLSCTSTSSTDVDLQNKVKVVINLEGLKDAGGLLYMGCKGNTDKTDPAKISEWFTADFVNMHRVFAIKEQEPFVLRIFTRNHEATNRTIRKKGGRKVMLMGQEVFGDVLLACGRCGYWSHEGSNVRRHIKKAVCLKEKDYSKEDLIGLDRTERRKFLRRVAAAKCRAKKKAKDYAAYLVEIQDTCGVGEGTGGPLLGRLPQPRVKRAPARHKALTLGPVVQQEVVHRLSYDVFTVSDKQERVAWKPPSCHKAAGGGEVCQIVFKGARMKRRCLDLPLPVTLIYRKLDCKTHHCNFTLFHPNARAAFKKDAVARASVNVKMYGDIVMTQEFYHYIVSLLSVMKMKSSQTARHLTGVWETIISERLATSPIPEEYRKIITLSKQTVKSMWASIEEEAGSRAGLPFLRGPRRKKRIMAPPSTLQQVPTSLPPESSQSIASAAQSGLVSAPPCSPVTQPPTPYHAMKRINNHIVPKPPNIVASPPKPIMMHPPLPPGPPPPPLPPHQNTIQQSPHGGAVTQTHWLGQTPQYPHNMAPYPMAPPPTAEYYPMPGHFVAQYTSATMGTSA